MAMQAASQCFRPLGSKRRLAWCEGTSMLRGRRYAESCMHFSMC